MSEETFVRLVAGDTPKGDVLAAARIAGIQAAKRTSELIPLCHLIALTRVEVNITLDGGVAIIDASAEARDRTGVEMEAMVAASTAALTLYDMLKAVDRGMSFDVCLVEKRRRQDRHLDAPGARGAMSGLIDIRETPLSLDEVVKNVTRPGAGGIATFVGMVRDESEGRAVTRLDYSSYAGMAKREMQKIVDEIESEIPGARVSAIHRVGQLGIGDLAVVRARPTAARPSARAAS